jgi:hypothetical protein
MSEQKSKSFWSTMPGILTGLAAVITAVGGLLIVLSDGLPVFPSSPGPAETQPQHAETQPVSGFRIVELALRADPFDYTGPCPITIEFSGRVSVAGGGGTVSYKFLRSDGASAPVQTLEFDSAGSKPVVTRWSLGGSFSGWRAIKTFDPEEKESGRATFEVRCE